MNVVLVISDTLRRDHLGCYGNSRVRTPHLDRFSQRCLVFDRAYTGSFPTVLCRNDIFTGRWTFTYRTWAPLAAEEQTLAEVLNEAGVLTGLVADTPHPYINGFNYQRDFQTWELIRGQSGDRWKSAPADPRLPGPDDHFHNAGRLRQYLRNVSERRLETDWFAPQTTMTACQWLERSRGRSPFFLCVDLFDPHEPWDPPRRYVDLYDPDYEGDEIIDPRNGPIDYLTSPELRHCAAMYAGKVTMVDAWLGHLFDRIESLRLLDDTTVIVLSDHGCYLGEHGYICKAKATGGMLPLYPEVAAIPLMVYSPGRLGGTRTDALVNLVDLFPTICELLGVTDLPARVRGRSFIQTLADPGVRQRDLAISSAAVFHADGRTPDPNCETTIIDQEWLLVSAGAANGATGAPRAAHLYHLPDDPGCRHDAMREHPDEAMRLHRAYLAFLAEAGLTEDHIRFRNRL